MDKNKTNKKTQKVVSSASKARNFSIYIYIQLIPAIILTFFSLSFHADISLVAFPVALIYTAITVFFCLKTIKQQNAKLIPLILRLTQYLPFVHLFCFVIRRAGQYGTPFWYDMVTVISWWIVFIFSFVLTSCMNEKNIKIITEKWTVPYEKPPKRHGAKWVLYEALDWIDNIIQAVFTVLIFQIFVLQLYVIPSESMVPTFLIKDRVMVTKLDCGPKFPLTDIGFNAFTKYKRGNVVVVRNPHYKIDRKSEIKTVTSQLVNMLTFMTVNLNTDENGQMKYDPLVKRICGVPGEQLVMQDGTLYRRTQESDVFTPVEEDAKYACWDLSSINRTILPKVETFPLAFVQPNRTGSNLTAAVKSQSENYQTMLDFEEKRRNYDLNTAAYRARELVRNMKSLAFKDNLLEGFEEPSLDEYDLFMGFADDTRKIMNSAEGLEWFEKFLTSWIDSKDSYRDIYEESNFRLNVMTKMLYGELVARGAYIMRSNTSLTAFESDTVISELMQQVEVLDWYIRGLLDSRNMPVFPANEADGTPVYIPKNCYFMMGDNRFNSLDFRHSDKTFQAPLTEDDKLSVTYSSQMDPHYVDRKLIIGKPTYRFWPLTRRGSIQP